MIMRRSFFGKALTALGGLFMGGKAIADTSPAARPWPTPQQMDLADHAIRTLQAQLDEATAEVGIIKYQRDLYRDTLRSILEAQGKAIAEVRGREWKDPRTDMSVSFCLTNPLQQVAELKSLAIRPKP